MSTSKDLFLAILCIGSYRRGCSAGISDGGAEDTDGLGESGSKIGNATVKDVDIPSASEAAGFYAVAYTVGSRVDGFADGCTVIS